MKLDPGVYKLCNSAIMPSHVYLRVFKMNNQMYYDVNGGVASMTDKYGNIPLLDGYSVVKKLTSIDVDKISMTLNWIDSDGDNFTYQVKDINPVRNLFMRYPALPRAMNSKKY